MRGPNHQASSGRPHLAGKTNRNPLRAVLCTEIDCNGIAREVLVCGHRQYIREDMIGPTYAMRRRCAKCAEVAK